MNKTLLHSFFNQLEEVPFKVKYWDGELRSYNDGPAKLTFKFKKEPSIDAKWSKPIVAFGEAYMDDIVDFEGDIEDLTKIITKNRSRLEIINNGLLGKTADLVANRLVNDPKEQIQYHYDLGNDFYELWLDPTMSYSCAYFKTPDDSLHTAQMNKINHVLKKLQLKPGESLLDIGSGWGRLLIQAAEKYGVKATGVTLSEEQYVATVELINKLKLSDSVEVLLTDFRELDQFSRYDKIVSIGMFEHVGKDNLKDYFSQVNKLLKPGGISLLHSIMGFKEGKTNEWMTRHIFPGGFIPSLRETIHLLPEFDFHLLHAESLRLHYTMTLDHWLTNYLKHWDLITETYGNRFARMWKLYLLGCSANFRISGLDIYQLVFTKELNNQIELTMRHIYED